MRQGFTHEAVLVMGPDGDPSAPGAAITVELCGHWDHQPPCPLAPHHTRSERVGDAVRLRILFAAEPEQEKAVRERIDLALSRGRQEGPDGAVSRWQVQDSRRGDPAPQDADHLERLTR